MAKVSSDNGKGVPTTNTQPFRGFYPFEEFDRVFSEMMPGRWPRLSRFKWPDNEEGLLSRNFSPRIDLIERDDEFLLRAELPGVDKKDVDVSVSENRVVIKADTKQEHREEKGDYRYSEIHQGSFSRTVTLPGYVNADKAKAGFKDGILELHLPKQEKTHKRNVKID